MGILHVFARVDFGFIESELGPAFRLAEQSGDHSAVQRLADAEPILASYRRSKHVPRTNSPPDLPNLFEQALRARVVEDLDVDKIFSHVSSRWLTAALEPSDGELLDDQIWFPEEGFLPPFTERCGLTRPADVGRLAQVIDRIGESPEAAFDAWVTRTQHTAAARSWFARALDALTNVRAYDIPSPPDAETFAEIRETMAELAAFLRRSGPDEAIVVWR